MIIFSYICIYSPLKYCFIDKKTIVCTEKLRNRRQDQESIARTKKVKYELFLPVWIVAYIFSRLKAYKRASLFQKVHSSQNKVRLFCFLYVDEVMSETAMLSKGIYDDSWKCSYTKFKYILYDIYVCMRKKMEKNNIKSIFFQFTGFGCMDKSMGG